MLKLTQEGNDQNTTLGKSLDNYLLRYEQETVKLADLKAKRIKEENIIRRLENSKVEIRKIVEEKVRVLLSNRKAFLNLVVLCMMESIRESPER